MKRILLSFAAAGALGAAAAPAVLAQDAGAQAGAAQADSIESIESFSEGAAQPLSPAEQERAVEEASAYLAGLEALSARFQQVNPDGKIVEGDLYMQRPGRMRFAYDPPSRLLIVADGRTVASIDQALETVDRVAIDETPLAYLLQEDVDLARDAEIRGAARQDGLVFLSVDDPRGRIAGQLILVFSEPEFALREWVAVDDYGRQTRVILSDVTRRAALDPELFTYELDTSSRRPGQR